MLKMLNIAVWLNLLFLAPSWAAPLTETPMEKGWPCWRGPGWNGVAAPGDFPVKWSSGENIAWKAELPGRGCSTPIVWGEHIILTSPAGGKDTVLDFDRFGKKRWQAAFGQERTGKHRTASGSNPSPVTDGDVIIAYYKSGALAALDFKGQVLWKTNLQERFGKDTLWWDLGTSPVLTRRHAVVAVMHAGDSFIAAFEKRTGELAWKVSRNYACAREGDQSYTTPVVIEKDGEQRIIVWGAEHVTAHDAGDGKMLWSCGGFNPQGRKNWVTVASPVICDDTVVVPYGRGSRLAGVKLGGEGDVTGTHRLWTLEDAGSFVPTPAVHDGKIYILDDRGGVRCIAPKTGEILWSGELPRDRAMYYASPVIAGGKLYAAREDGVIFVASIQGSLEILSMNALGERIIASPVPVDGQLFLRGESHLFCVKAP